MHRRTVLESSLKDLVAEIIYCNERLDRAMKEKESFERGKEIGKIWSEINYITDAAMHFDLKYSFTKIKKIKNRIASLKQLPQMRVESDVMKSILKK